MASEFKPWLMQPGNTEEITAPPEKGKKYIIFKYACILHRTEIIEAGTAINAMESVERLQKFKSQAEAIKVFNSKYKLGQVIAVNKDYNKIIEYDLERCTYSAGCIEDIKYIKASKFTQGKREAVNGK